MINLTDWIRRTRDALKARPPEAIEHAYTLADVETVLGAAITALVDELIAGGEVHLTDLGTLSVESRAERNVQSNLPSQQRAYQVMTRRRVVFRASKRLNKLVNSPETE